MAHFHLLTELNTQVHNAHIHQTCLHRPSPRYPETICASGASHFGANALVKWFEGVFKRHSPGELNPGLGDHMTAGKLAGWRRSGVIMSYVIGAWSNTSGCWLGACLLLSSGQLMKPSVYRVFDCFLLDFSFSTRSTFDKFNVARLAWVLLKLVGSHSNSTFRKNASVSWRFAVKFPFKKYTHFSMCKTRKPAATLPTSRWRR